MPTRSKSQFLRTLERTGGGGGGYPGQGSNLPAAVGIFTFLCAGGDPKGPETPPTILGRRLGALLRRRGGGWGPN